MSKRILIVEDDFLIAMTAEEALHTAGFEVVGIATTFEEALRMAGEHRPHLVLMDIRLASQRDGVEAAIEIRRRYGIPSLFTSANQDCHNMARAKPAGPAGWLPKPYAMDALVAAVRKTALAHDSAGR